MKLVVDTRWCAGDHGIARWGREVVGRLPMTFTPLQGATKPASALDPVRIAAHTVAADVFFSPGYNAGLPTRARQLLVLHDLIHLDVAAETSPAKRAYYAGVVRPAVRRAGVVLTVSAFSRERVADWSGLDPDRVLVAGAALSGGFRDLGPRVVPARPYALVVGLDRPHKRLTAAVDAVLATPALDLVVVGDPGPELRESAARLGPRLHLRAGLSDADLGALYRDAACLLFPSGYEGFGLPALEALAVGTPVVHTAAAVAEVVGDCGVHVPVEAGVAGLADALTRAPALRAAPDWAARCAARVARHSWERCAAVVAEALETLT